MGYTGQMRIDVLTQHPAPVTIEYLGYPGTMGVNFIDYIIADHQVCPPGAEAEFSENVLRLPHCFFPANNETQISSTVPSRAEAGLPEKGLVFCAFNQAFKITPGIFDVWMRILAAVEGSVLWLSVGGIARLNLRREAEARGIDPARLVFAERVESRADHLARHALADLFLDTPNYNAHTTAADSLWAGLPLVTVSGPSFAGRVAASMLHTLGLSELVATSLAEYERLVLELAADETRRAALRNRLVATRATSPLFDIATYTRHLEDAYLYAHGRSRAGLPPRSHDIPATA
jgi:predicted O-linked N-acetylglucosamine transferase (SPINDLY family)